MDLSWSRDHKVNASTLLKNLQLEVKKNINELTTNVHQLDSVNSALNEGQTTFGQILCETCKTAIESKYKELHSEEDQPQIKKKYKTLAPERQRIVNEITKVFIELERSQSTDKGGEQYCTQEEYHAQQMLELENKYKKDLQNNKAEILALKKQVKKVISERDDNNKKLQTMSSHPTSNGKIERELRRFETENKRLQSKLETSERRNDQLRKDVERSEDDLRKQRQSFDEERRRRENEDVTDGNIRSLHNEVSNLEAVRPEHEHDVNASNRGYTTDRQTGQKPGLLLKSKNDNVSSARGNNQDIGDVDSAQEETLQKLKQIEKGASIVQKENDDYRRIIVEFQTEKKTLEDKTVTLQKTNEEMALVMKDLQRDNEKLIRERDEFNSDLVKMRRGSDRYDRDENEKYIREIEKLERDKRTLRKENDSLRRTNDETSSAMRDLQRDHDSLTDELGKREQETHEMKKVMEENQPQERRSLDEYNSDLVQLQKGTDRYDGDQNEKYIREIEKLEMEKRTLQEQYDLLRKSNEETVSSLRDSQQQDHDDLSKELDDYNSDLDKMQRKSDRYDRDQNDKYIREIEKLERDKRTLRKENDSLRRTNDETSSAMRDLQRDHDSLTDEFEQETHEMKKNLEDIQPLERRSLEMKLKRGYRSGVGRAMVDMVFKELKEKLEGRFDSENINLSIVLSSTHTNIATVHDGPSFVLCLNTYVQVALGNIKDDRHTYILALHQIDHENLSLLTPTGNSLTGSELQKLGGLLDMAFSSDDGLYECDLNETAFDKIVNLLKQY